MFGTVLGVDGYHVSCSKGAVGPDGGVSATSAVGQRDDLLGGERVDHHVGLQFGHRRIWHLDRSDTPDRFKALGNVDSLGYFDDGVRLGALLRCSRCSGHVRRMHLCVCIDCRNWFDCRCCVGFQIIARRFDNVVSYFGAVVVRRVLWLVRVRVGR